MLCDVLGQLICRYISMHRWYEVNKVVSSMACSSIILLTLMVLYRVT